MCGRINLRTSSIELATFFELFREPEAIMPRYNLGPMQQILVVRQHPKGVRLAEPMKWGLVPAWAKEPSVGSKLTNARSDTVDTKPAFREAFQKRRCLIPADGFYEWQRINAHEKQAWHMFARDGHPLSLAGLWEHWNTPNGDVLETFSIITTDANGFMADVHNRMPVIIPKSDWAMWLDPEYKVTAVLKSLLIPSPEDLLEKTAVSSFVNAVKNDSPECIRPIHADRLLF